MKRPERVAVVDKIEDQRKPEDFIGHHNRGAMGAPPVTEEERRALKVTKKPDTMR